MNNIRVDILLFCVRGINNFHCLKVRNSVGKCGRIWNVWQSLFKEDLCEDIVQVMVCWVLFTITDHYRSEATSHDMLGFSIKLHHYRLEAKTEFCNELNV